jgi:hypothetical protein
MERFMENNSRIKHLLPVLVSLMLASTAFAAPGRLLSPNDNQPTAPGYRYRLAATLTAGQSHIITFTLRDDHGQKVVTDTFSATQLKRDIVEPIFILFRDDPDAFSQARDHAADVVVYADGKQVDHLTFSALKLDAAALDGFQPHAFFVNPRPRLIRHQPANEANSSPATNAARKSIKPTTFTESWAGCNDDDYCYAQWNYCNENCAPWDPYNPCEACNSNLEACTGGIKTAEWTEDTDVSQTATSYYGCHNGNLYNEVTHHFHRQTFQTWMCDEADGTHWFTINTAESYYDLPCWEDYFPGYPGCPNPGAYPDPGNGVIYC